MKKKTFIINQQKGNYKGNGMQEFRDNKIVGNI